MSSPLRVSLIGLGALGILYSDILVRRPDLCTLTIIADKERQARYAKTGVFCNGTKLELNYLAPEDKPEQPAELMLVAVKGTTLDSAIADIRNHMGPGTIVVSVLNGITSEEFLEKAYPDAKVLRCVSQGMDALRVDQTMTATHAGMLYIGAPKGRDDLAEPLKKTLDFLNAAGIKAVGDDDIEHRLYCKWMLNVGVNQCVTVFEGTYGTVKEEGMQREMCLGAMREAMAIANAEGVNLTEKDFEEYKRVLDGLSSDSMPSMRQDALAGRRTEMALFAGTVLEKGRKLGIDTPINYWLNDELVNIDNRATH
ncbi:MAG: 2-dehydropantoate 2-reductase [Desulfovibrionaceae bacterium]|nr:2-dehydropantoate 2-reductase [Desulfovibrionaceae bacterium]